MTQLQIVALPPAQWVTLVLMLLMIVLAITNATFALERHNAKRAEEADKIARRLMRIEALIEAEIRNDDTTNLANSLWRRLISGTYEDHK